MKFDFRGLLGSHQYSMSQIRIGTLRHPGLQWRAGSEAGTRFQNSVSRCSYSHNHAGTGSRPWG